MRHIRGLATIVIVSAVLTGMPAAAQNAHDPNVQAEDIPTQPLKDLNLDKDEVPPLLIDVAGDPYSAQGLQTCSDIEQAIADLDAILGDDIDLPGDKSDVQKAANSAGRIAKSFIGGIIPFRGVVREISGARAEERRVRKIVLAGLIRRGYLKGIGLERGCPWPARPAAGRVEFDDAAAERAAQRQSQTTGEQIQPAATQSRFVSEPVIQPTP